MFFDYNNVVILYEKTKLDLGMPVDDCSTRTKIWLQCDYCGSYFQRDKKTRKKLNKTIDKDSCVQCSNQKRNDVNLILYGNKNYFKSEDFKNKSQDTLKHKFGKNNYFQTEDFKSKRNKTLQEKYGVTSPLQNDKIKEKQRMACKKKFGVENYAQHKDFLDKRNATNLKKYGAKNAMQTEATKHKREETSVTKFGVRSFTQTKEYWERRKHICQGKYGVEHPHQLPETIEKMRQTNMSKYGVESYAQTEEFKKRYKTICFEKLGVPNPLCLVANRAYGKTQQEIQQWLKSIGANFQTDYKLLEGKEIDLYCPEKFLAIEYCGLYWHTEASPAPRNRAYHYSKYNKCKNQGVQLITLFEDEWLLRQDQCKNFLRATMGVFDKKIYARQCFVKEIEKENFNAFCDATHIQGSNNLGLFFGGLFYKDQLVGAMSLGRHHRNQSLTLDRLCFAPGILVVGGASKLFKFCVNWAKKQGHKKIISWSDNRWSKGGVYEKMGFVLEAELGPDYAYVDIKKPYCRISKQSQKKSNTGCPPDKSEREWAAEHGLARMWDCGKKRWGYGLVS